MSAASRKEQLGEYIMNDDYAVHFFSWIDRDLTPENFYVEFKKLFFPNVPKEILILRGKPAEELPLEKINYIYNKEWIERNIKKFPKKSWVLDHMGIALVEIGFCGKFEKFLAMYEGGIDMETTDPKQPKKRLIGQHVLFGAVANGDLDFVKKFKDFNDDFNLTYNRWFKAILEHNALGAFCWRQTDVEERHLELHRFLMSEKNLNSDVYYEICCQIVPLLDEYNPCDINDGVLNIINEELEELPTQQVEIFRDLFEKVMQRLSTIKQLG